MSTNTQNNPPVSAEPVAWMLEFNAELETDNSAPGITTDPLEAEKWRHEGYELTPLGRLSAPVAAKAQQYASGGNLADRLDGLADTASPGSQMQSDLYAAATIWRKHLKGPAVQQPVSGADGLPKLTDSMLDAAVEYIDAHGICIEPDQMEGIVSAALAQQPARGADDAMERALTELVYKIVPGLDTGDLLADAATASKALDSVQQDADKVDTWRSDDVDLHAALTVELYKHPQTRAVIGREALVLRCVRAAIDAARKENSNA